MRCSVSNFFPNEKNEKCISLLQNWPHLKDNFASPKARFNLSSCKKAIICTIKKKKV